MKWNSILKCCSCTVANKDPNNIPDERYNFVQKRGVKMGRGMLLPRNSLNAYLSKGNIVTPKITGDIPKEAKTHVLDADGDSQIR